MTNSQSTTIETCHPASGTGGSEAIGRERTQPSRSLPVRVIRRIRNHFRHSWKMAWLKRSGQSGFGRLAARMACLDSPPYHGRAYLADLVEKGFVAPGASINHGGLRLGKNVYLGDNNVISRGHGGGEVWLEDRVQIYGDTFIETGAGGSIRIGEGTHIQPGCHLHAYIEEINIGRQVEIAPGCGFYCYDHGIEPGIPIMEQPLTSKGGIIIGDGAWLGYRATVLQGVKIGAGAVIAAGSVVVRDIPDNAIAAGVPAKVIRYRGDPP